MFGTIVTWLVGGGFNSISKQLTDAYRLKLEAQTNEDKLAADIMIQRLETQRAIASIEANDRWSALRIGRLLVVVPFGIWWAAIFAVSTFDLAYVVKDIPPRIWDMVTILIPAILLGEVAQSGLRWWKR